MAPSKKAGKKSAATVAPAKPKAGGANKVVKADWKEGFKKKQTGVSDMTLLTTISNESVNDNLEKRWKNREIYTYIGAVLISVNPFRDLGIYTAEVLASYKGKNRLEMPPHVYAIAESSYYNMNAYKQNQCVIITGESGAGKTEAAKQIMQYIAAVSGSGAGGDEGRIGEIKEMVLATNPLLESFGCAKTLRNNNSSRHGKYLEIMFNERGEPVGAQITNYLLEKNRVVGQIDNERDFHMFYQFTKGASDAQREMFGLQGPEAYVYTSKSNCLDVQGINDVKDFADTMKAMSVIGLSSAEQTEILRVIAVILWLGNVQFEEMDDGNARIADKSVTDFVGYLMEADGSAVEKVLTTRVVETQRGGRRGSVYDVPLNPAQASSGRDALAKGLYNNLFEWIVARINISMAPQHAYTQLIGVLDIYGFEIFQDNSFEQLCINYVNEKLQQIFIELTLKTEQEEYVREEIKWTPINYFNNKVVCDLIEERRPPGIFAALNDACATAHADPAAADQSFMQRLSALSGNPHFETRGEKFLVRHYAGDVMYNVSGMTDKNKDSLVKDILDLIDRSGNKFLHTLFPDRPDPNSKKRPPTAGDRIKASAGALVENLTRAQPSYIRTIKPNQNRSSSEYDTKAILHQIKYLGLQENIRVRRAGFAYRNTFEKMIERFYLLSKATSYAGVCTWEGDPKSGCERILLDTGIAREEWQMGVTKAFIKNPETLFALETMRDRFWHNMAARIQRAWRSYWRYKNDCARKIQRFWKNNKEGIAYAQARDYGHQVLAGRKERRRFSLLGSRRFMGDYLGIGSGDALGDSIKPACGIGNEPIIFSSRIEILVSKFGRTSKLSPRYLVLTGKAVHILAAVAGTNGRPTISLERKLPLVTIRSVSMSSMRDDWLALNGPASEEGDPLITCVFKTELVSDIVKLTQGSVNVLIGPTIEYAQKKDKKRTIKFVRDESAKNDPYKSQTISVSSGEPPNSVSRPVPKRKPRPTQAGKPSQQKSGPSSNGPRAAPKPKPQAVASQLAPPIVVKPSAPVAVTAGGSAARAAASAPKRTSVLPPPPPPPPPPAPPAEPEVPQYKAVYDFAGQEGELSLAKGDLVELVEKDDNGWWLVKLHGKEGWAPSNYLELVPPKPKAPPPPPAPAPTRRALPNAPAPAAAAVPAVSKPTAPTPAAAAIQAAKMPTAPTPSAAAIASAALSRSQGPTPAAAAIQAASRPTAPTPSAAAIAAAAASRPQGPTPAAAAIAAASRPTLKPTPSAAAIAAAAASRPTGPTPAAAAIAAASRPTAPTPSAAAMAAAAASRNTAPSSNGSANGKPPAPKPKPAIAAKPGAHAPPIGAKPPVPPPAAARPPAAPRPGGAVKPSGSAPGQMDLAAALQRRAQRVVEDDDE